MSRFGFANSCPISTPISVNLSLPVLDTPEVDVHDYQSRIGSVMYAMLGTRPDIAYAVGALSQYLSNPGKAHLAAVNRLLRYLNATKHYKIVYNGKSPDDDNYGYADSNWAGDQ